MFCRCTRLQRRFSHWWRPPPQHDITTLKSYSRRPIIATMMSSSVMKNENTTAPAADSAAAFAFVTELAKEVSSGKVELPSFPDVAVRVRKVLADEHVSNEQIARVVGSEAGLAARVFTLANSAALNRAGRSVSDLKMAVNRIGHNNVRTAAVS